MLYAALKTLHLLAIILWVGGMTYTLFFLRPAVTALELPLRVRLMHEVLRRFFATVLAAIVVVLATGGAMMAIFAGSAPSIPPVGSEPAMPWSWTVMATLGVLMAAIFGHIRFVLFKRLHVAMLDQKWTLGGAALASIRSWVRVNLVIGLVIVLVAGLGRG